MSARRPSIESATRAGPVPSRSQRRARLCASSRTRTDPSSSTSNAVAPIAGRVRPGSSPTFAGPSPHGACDEPGSATRGAEHVPAESNLRRIEEWEGPVGRVGSASGHEEALVAARDPKLGVVLESFTAAQRSPRAPSPSAAGFHRPRKVRAAAHGTAHARRCGDGPFPRRRSRARDPRCRRAHSGRRRRDERVRPEASGAVAGASRRRRARAPVVDWRATAVAATVATSDARVQPAAMPASAETNLRRLERVSSHLAPPLSDTTTVARGKRSESRRDTSGAMS